MTEDSRGTPPAGQAPADPDEAIRLGRRRFFRALASDAMRTAANVVGVAGALQKTSAEVAGAILAGSELAPETAVAATGPAPAAAGTLAPSPVAAGAVHAFRSPFRFDDDALVLLDQRRLPGDLLEVACRTAVDLRVAIIEGVVRGASILAQTCACAMALAAAGTADSRPYARRAVLTASGNQLRSAAGSAMPVRRAIARMTAVMNRRPEYFGDGIALAAAMRAEAEAIIGEATLDHAGLGRWGLELFGGEEPAGTPSRLPIRILTLGSVGALASGQIGTVLAVANALVTDGRPIEVVVCETRPSLAGTRLTGWELAAAGIPYEIIPDAGAGSLIAGGEVDIILVGADSIAANGDVLGEPGTCALGLLAARFEVPFAVVATAAAIDPGAADGREFRAEPRAAHDLLALAGKRIAPAGATARNPGFDLTPAALVGAIVTEQGVFSAPYVEALAAAEAIVAARTPAPPPPAPPPPVEPGTGAPEPDAAGDA